MKTGAAIMRIVAVLMGIGAPAVAAVVGGADAGWVMSYIFLSFCALIVIGQVIPLISGWLAAGQGRTAEGQATGDTCDKSQLHCRK